MLESGDGADIGKGTQPTWNSGQGKSRRLRKKEEGANSGEGEVSLKTEKRGKRKVADSECSPEAKESEDKRKKNKRKEEEARDKYRAKVGELDQRKIKEIIGGGEEEKDTGKETDKVGEKVEEEAKMGENDDLITLMKNMSVQMEEAKRERQAMRKKLEEIENGIKKQGKDAKGDIERLKAGMEKANEEMKRKVDKLEKGLEEKKKEEERWRENVVDRLNRLEEKRAEKMEIQEEEEEEVTDEERKKKRLERDRKREEAERKEKEVERMIEREERERKKRNVIITGLEERDRKDKESVEGWIRRKLKKSVRIRKIWTIRSSYGKSKIGVQLEKWEEKEEVIGSKAQLGSEKIFIDHDLTWKERRNKEKVLEKARELKKGGEKARIGYNKVTTETEEWFWNERMEKWFQRRVQRDKDK